MYELLISMGIQALVMMGTMVVLVLNHRREIKNSKAREDQLYAAVISKEPNQYTQILETLRTDPVMRGKLMEIENELALNTQKALDSERSTTGYPIY